MLVIALIVLLGTAMAAFSAVAPESQTVMDRMAAALPRPILDEHAILTGALRYSADVDAALAAASPDSGAEGATVTPSGGVTLTVSDGGTGTPGAVQLGADDPQDRDSTYTLYPTATP